ncbi:MAG TPA: hypothetical protein V6D12_00550 [Candidatus Obscuribacterales bacterium]
MIEVISDWLLWIVVSACLSQLVVATVSFWGVLPPFILILIAMLIVLIGGQLLAKLMPIESHWTVYVFRAVQVGLGVVLVVVRLP